MQILVVLVVLSALIAFRTKKPPAANCGTGLFRVVALTATIGWAAVACFAWPQNGFGKAMFISLPGLMISALNFSSESEEEWERRMRYESVPGNPDYLSGWFYPLAVTFVVVWASGFMWMIQEA